MANWPLNGKGVAVAIKISPKVVAVVAIAAVVMIAAAVSLRLSDRTALDSSVNALKEDLDSDYEVEREHFGDSVTDVSGVWSVRSRSDLSEKIASKAEFAKADEDDLRYFKQLVVDAFGSGEALDGYVLYRSERSLGDGSVCNTAPCSIYVLGRPGSKLSYVGIYKT
ncbi:hypothetical protein [Steroidobacter cummioxidans]|uniref:hypothetical protein n=1 Tax=Steroidobacter cummioxidans TaxID=1803913 RepID=UPI001290373C|nr:hypothetical protein [Steroidobacter cummioxidans]